MSSISMSEKATSVSVTIYAAFQTSNTVTNLYTCLIPYGLSSSSAFLEGQFNSPGLYADICSDIENHFILNADRLP